jgi:hypothetical protein
MKEKHIQRIGMIGGLALGAYLVWEVIKTHRQDPALPPADTDPLPGEEPTPSEAFIQENPGVEQVDPATVTVPEIYPSEPGEVMPKDWWLLQLQGWTLPMVEARLAVVEDEWRAASGTRKDNLWQEWQALRQRRSDLLP